MNNADMITSQDIMKIFGAYGKDDYVRSDEPYLVLMASIKELNSIQRQAVINSVKGLAKEAGCPNQTFNEMLQAARHTVDRVIPDGNGFPGIENLLNGNVPRYGTYTCSGEGVYLFREKDNSYDLICPHPIFPTRRYKNTDTGIEMLDISYYRDGKWHTLRMIPRKTMIEASQITALGEIGLGINSENARELVKFLSVIDEKNREIIPAIETTGRMGWLGDRGFVPYIPDVIYDEAGNYREMFNAIRREGSPEEWVKLARIVRANKDNPAGKMILAASVASVILPWTCDQSFMVHLWSPMSGTGKTLALMLAASVWADPTMGRYLKPLNSTDTALEQLENFCNNLPLCLDELESVQNKDTNGTVYRLCEGMGKNRATKNLGVREQTHWLNVIITNGEHPITDDSKGGSINRVISVESTGLLFPGGELGLSEAADKMKRNFGHAGAMIIEMISNGPNWKNMIQSLYQDYKTRLLEKATGKQASYGAALMVGDWLLENIVTQDDNQITVDEIMSVLATPEMADVNLRAQRIVNDYIAANLSGFVHENDPEDALPRSIIRGKKMNNGNVYVIQNELQRSLEESNINFTGFMKWCQKRNLIHTSYGHGKERHWGITVRLPGMKNLVRAICFLPAFFSNVDKESQMTIVETDSSNPFSS